MKRLVLLGLGLTALAACGDNHKPGSDIDAPAIDSAPPIDMPDDAPPVERFGGTITLLEAQVLGGANGVMFGEGIQLGASFSDNTLAPVPVLDTAPGTPFGCKVFELNAAQQAAALGVNEGTVAFTVDNPTGTDPTFPTCFFVAGAGYVCPDFGSSQSPGATTTSISATNNVVLSTMTAGQTATMTLSGTTTASFGAEDVGRYVKFLGTGNPGGVPLDASTTALPILAVISGTVAVVALPLPAATTIPVTAGIFQTLAGVGPQPGLQDPGQLADAATGTATITGGALGGGSDFGNNAISFSNVGDDFTMTPAMYNSLLAIPTNGSAFTIGCDSAGNLCGDGSGAVLNIVTTDGSVAGLSPFAMPPATKRVNVRCAGVGITDVTIPANVSAHLMTAGATRIQTTYVRARFGVPNPSDQRLIASISGHAVVGFTSP